MIQYWGPVICKDGVKRLIWVAIDRDFTSRKEAEKYLQR